MKYMKRNPTRKAFDFIDLVPKKALLVTKLSLYLELPKKGYYFCLHDNGELKHIGFAKVKKRQWVDHPMDGKICCHHFVTISKDQLSGSYRSEVGLTRYKKNGELSSSACYSENETAETANLTFEAWMIENIQSILKMK